MTDQPIHILMIDDDEDDFFLVNELLRDISPGQYLLEWAPTYAKAVEEIAQKRHAVYLVDYRLGPYTGIDILHHFNQLDYRAPVIMLTGKGDYTIDREAMMAGASDYLVKGEISADQLERAIRYALDEASHLRTIEESEKKYYGIFEKAHDLILLADCDMNVIDANPAALRVLHYSKEEMLKMNLKQLFFFEEQRRHFIDFLCEGNAITQTEYNFITREGKKLDVQVNAAMLDEVNKIFLCVVQDLTEKKREEQEKQQQQKLVLTGRIARVIAHEVRNPLTNILLAVSQFKEEPAHTEDGKLYMDIIERNCIRINQLITELLHSTRMIELNMQPQGINDLTKRSLKLAQDRLQLNGITVEEQLIDPDIVISADTEKVEIALLNIIINAIEAMTPGKGVLTLHTARLHDKALIRISDNGPGIPEETRARLFDPFFTSKPKGTGLGLTSTQNIIMNHKGSIHVESEPGHGAIFSVTFPVI